MNVPDPRHDRRQRRLLVALALLFFLPLATSFYLYYGAGSWRPARQVNRGDLISPARPLPRGALPLAAADGGTTPSDVLEKKWTFLYWGSGSCSAACRTKLYETRQVRLLLNRNLDRVQRVFIADGGCCDWQYLKTEHPDLITVRAGSATTPILERLPTYGGVAAAQADRVYLIDPLGNLMMSYAADAPAKGMLEDIKRLLGLSHVG